MPFWREVRGEQVASTFSFGATAGVSFGGEDDDEEHDHDAHDHDAHDHDAHVDDTHDHDAHADDADDHSGHDDRPTPAPRPANVEDVARGGESFRLPWVIAPGRVSVIDFWATWCAPCAEITHRLEALAARHPELSVSRVEVPDSDAPVAEEHLAGVDRLPVVWIYDRAGQRAATLVGCSPDEALAAVEAALAKRPAPGPEPAD